jgi:hypothetical protein
MIDQWIASGRYLGSIGTTRVDGPLSFYPSVETSPSAFESGLRDAGLSRDEIAEMVLINYDAVRALNARQQRPVELRPCAFDEDKVEIPKEVEELNLRYDSVQQRLKDWFSGR